MLSNAVKYTESGGHIRLDVSEYATETENVVGLEIKVTDDGCGMSEEYVKHIFEPFSRAESHLTNRVQGTGLGMAITDKIVTLMGGTIAVTSEIDKGSCFTLRLPL